MFKIIQKLKRYFITLSFAILDDKAGLWKVPISTNNIGYLRAKNSKGGHVLVRPEKNREEFYVLCDDLSWSDIQRDHRRNKMWKPGRLVVETSPHNYQVWIHSATPLSLPEKAYWLKRMGSDPGCSPQHRWGRCPGFRNRKIRYEKEGMFPLARLVWIDWKHKANIPKIDFSDRTDRSRTKLSPFPSPTCGLCVRDISRKQYERGDESATDFAYMLALLRRNVSEQEIIYRIMRERKDWKNHETQSRRDFYIKTSLQKAKTIIG